MSGLYSAALAHIHADEFTAWQRPAYPWLIEHVRKTADQPHLHDLGCGDGAWLDAASAAGIEVSGSDISPAFVELARARGLDVVVSGARAAPWPDGTTAITALGEVLCYDDGDGAPFWDVAAAAAQDLSAGGLLIGDLIGPDTPAASRETEGDGWQMVSETRIDGERLTRRMTLAGAAATEEIVHLQTVFSPNTVETGLCDLGFSVEIRDSYGPCPLLPGRFSVMARRR